MQDDLHDWWRPGCGAPGSATPPHGASSSNCWRVPVTTTDIVRQEPNAPLSSVYRNLGVLSQVGAVRRVLGADDSARFELAEALTEHHHHLVCTDCGDVADFTLSARAEAAVNKALADAVASSNFEADAHRLDVLGRCARCRRERD